MVGLSVSFVNCLAIFCIRYYSIISLLLICKSSLYILDTNLCQFWTSSVLHQIAFNFFSVTVCHTLYILIHEFINLFLYCLCFLCLGEKGKDGGREIEGGSYALIKDKSIPDREKSQRRNPVTVKMFKVFEEQSARSQWGWISVTRDKW